MRTRVKICGITRTDDALLAAEFGADAIGLVFYAGSPRNVSVAQACSIIEVLPSFVTTVGLFLDADPVVVQNVAQAVPLDVLQFHGDEPADECRRYRQPYIKAVPMSVDTAGDAALTYMQAYPDAQSFLLDSHATGEAGGSGLSFDWTKIPGQRPKPIILAGGVTPDNVADAIRQTHPYAVDVSSGVEAEKGIKDRGKLLRFMQEVHNVDCNEV